MLPFDKLIKEHLKNVNTSGNNFNNLNSNYNSRNVPTNKYQTMKTTNTRDEGV